MQPKKQPFTGEQLERLQKLAKLFDGGKVAQVQFLFEMEAEIMDKLESLNERFAEIEERATEVTKQELKEVKQSLTEIIADFENVVSEKVEAGSKEIGTIDARVDALEKGTDTEIRPFVLEKIAVTEKSLAEKIGEVSALVGYLESRLVEKMDNESMQEHLAEMSAVLEAKLPTPFDATEIETDIEELEKKYQELEKKLASVGSTTGGVSNLRIQQAFKYILKRETPVGDIDGMNTTYTVTQPIFAVLAFSINGETIAQLSNYTIAGKTITFSTALPAVYSGKDFEIKYV